MHRAGGVALALLASLMLAFFFVFRTLFADGPAALLHPEYLVAHALNVVGYGAVLLLLARYVSPSPWWMAVAAPGGLIALLYTDPGLGLRLLTLAGLLAGTVAGWWAGTAWRRRAPKDEAAT